MPRPGWPLPRRSPLPGGLVLEFHEYFHGDDRLAASAPSHQTGWTGLVALLIQNHADVMAGAPMAEDPKPVGQTDAMRDTAAPPSGGPAGVTA